MIKLRKELGHLVSLRHVPGDVVTAGLVVDVSVRVNNLHYFVLSVLLRSSV
jgi:hypothetical protein